MRLPALLAIAAFLAAPAAWSLDRSESRRHGSIADPSSALHHDEEGISGTGFDLLHTRDSDRFRSQRARAGALVDYRSPYDLIAIGGGGTRYEQDGWSIDRYTLAGVIRKQERATGAGVVATAGVSTVGDAQKLIGEASWNVRAFPAGGFEFIGQREFVETRPGLEAGIMTDYFAASADLAVTDRLTLIGLAGGQWFSDDNRRTHLRGRAIYALLPEQGLAVQVRARGYRNSSAGGGFYFNPENYQRADLGLRLRRALGNWRVLAAAGAGREKIDHDAEKPTHYADLRAERSFANNFTLALTYSLSRASDSDSATGADYTWRYFRAVVILPF